ncbi:exopolyphosphatase [Bacillaceae bacterium Marseille-Q3522]|nr:exopolyphosphatase [Bacillaceae bacterium Marseille-Q3522]
MMKIVDLFDKQEIEKVKAEVKIGTAIYNTKMIDFHTVQHACEVIAGYNRMMRGYGVKDYRVVAVSSIKEAKNADYVKEQILSKTGLYVEWLTNAEERYLHNLAVIDKVPNFSKRVKEGTMLVDISSGSIQLTVYDQDQFIFSRNIKIGPLRIRELLADLEKKVINFTDLMEDYILSKMDSYQQFAPVNIIFKHFILVGTEMLLFQRAFIADEHDFVSKDHFNRLYNKMLQIPEDVLAKKFKITQDAVSQLIPTAMLIKKLLELTEVEGITLSNAELADGIILFYEKKQQKKTATQEKLIHDIVVSARNIANRYNCDSKHIYSVEKFALHLFDRLKALHRLKKRERLLLQLAVILQDIGSYIDINAHYIHSYYIVKASEIIGISDEERDIVANIVRYHSAESPSDDQINFSHLPEKQRLVIAKLAAILRIADALDDSHQQKITKITVSLKEDKVFITAQSDADLSLEKWTLEEKGQFFEEVYGVKPRLKG